MKEKTAYTKAELQEFKKLILKKIESAEEDLAILRASCANDALQNLFLRLCPEHY